jgi:alkylhydroperoxidase family enzyme
MNARIQPLQAPFSPDVEPIVASLMPPGVPPIGLFRTFAKNLPMTTAMRQWGGYELGKSLSLSMRARELVIDRTCARCGCEYEWGVHIAFFANRVGLTPEQIASVTHGLPSDTCWTSDDDRLILQAVDALHDDSDIDDHLWDRLSHVYSEVQLLDLMMLTGWYHAISFTARVSRIPLETGAPRFSDYSY